MSDLSTRVDGWSFQVMAESSARFLVRVTSSIANNRTIVFSDFILNPSDDARAVEALHLLKFKGFPLSPGTKLVFQEIHHSYRDEHDRAELLRRHDQIISVVKEYAALTGLTIKNTFLEPKAGKFETLVFIE